MPSVDPDPSGTNGSAIGSRVLAGGAITAFIGILLLIFGPSPTPGSPVNPHQMAHVFLGMGIFLLVAGAFARLFLRN
jgi:hypothetical protein